MTDSSDSQLESSVESSKVTTPPSSPSETSTPWRWHNPGFGDVLGAKPRLELLLERSYPFAHEAGVYFAASDELFTTSNRLGASKGNSEQHVQISKILLANTRGHDQRTASHEELRCGQIEMANGGVNYGDGILFCSQGSRTSSSGLYWMARAAPHTTRPILTHYHGVPFNSVNDVVVSKVDGNIWFTDPPYGSEQGYKGPALLPAQVYCYFPGAGGSKYGAIRAVADGFGHPNGLCFSPDEKVLYVTDTDKQHGSGEVFPQRPSSIYAFDVIRREGQPFLCNRRLFAFVEAGIPDGIKCDTAGRVYSGCGDGIHIWSPGGILLGRIQIAGGVANFCFGRPGELYALNEERLWRVRLAPDLTGALLSRLQVGDLSRAERDGAPWFTRLWRRLRSI